jgi:hypothetical protein
MPKLWTDRKSAFVSKWVVMPLLCGATGWASGTRWAWVITFFAFHTGIFYCHFRDLADSKE